MVSEQFDFFYRAKNEKSSSFRCDDVLLQQFFFSLLMDSFSKFTEACLLTNTCCCQDTDTAETRQTGAAFEPS